MAKYSKTLLLIASKLGLGEEEKILSKAAEFERLLQSKSAVSNISDTAKVVICLDLAASFCHSYLDLKSAIKCSGLKSSLYTNSRNVVENLLDLNSDMLTTTVLCVSLQCGVRELADKILEEYRAKVKMEIDLYRPQYVCMAVYQACRIRKVKVSKSKLIEKSRLKPAKWSKMDADWTKFVDANFATTKEEKGRSTNIVADKEDIIENMDVEITDKKEENTEPQMEPYEDWKKRILENAYKQLKKLQSDRHKHNLNKHSQNSNKERDSPMKHKQIENLNNLNESMKVERSSPRKHNKQNDISNKQNDNSNKHNGNTNIHNANTDRNIIFDTKQHTPRRSPRKTPQKLEPYNIPNKIKGVRLLFPSGE